MITLFGVTLTWPLAGLLFAAILGVIAVSMAAAALIRRGLEVWAHRRGIPPEDAGIPALRRYLFPVLLVAALHVALSALSLPRNLRVVVTRLLSVTTLALALYLTSQIILALLARFARRSEAASRAASQLLTMTRITLLVVGVAILLDNLGVRVTALVTTLGVSSLAVALALQDTLSNFFAGVYLQADRPFRLGDHVRLDSGHEGRVLDIGWRSTRLHTHANTTIVVPNERLLKSIITNYDLPDPQIAVSLQVTVPYGTDVKTVEQLLTEAVRRATVDVRGIVTDVAPTVRLIPGFGEFGLAFTLTAWVHAFADQEPAQDAVRRHVLELFRSQGIEIRRG